MQKNYERVKRRKVYSLKITFLNQRKPNILENIKNIFEFTLGILIRNTSGSPSTQTLEQ